MIYSGAGNDDSAGSNWEGGNKTSYQSSRQRMKRVKSNGKSSMSLAQWWWAEGALFQNAV